MYRPFQSPLLWHEYASADGFGVIANGLALIKPSDYQQVDTECWSCSMRQRLVSTNMTALFPLSVRLPDN